MNDAQVWAVIGVLSATIVGMVTFGFTMLLRVMRAELGTLRAESGTLRAESGTLRAELGSLRTEMRAGFERIDTRLDSMDRDINALMKHTFGIDRE